ncbi:hypothetical protein EVJ58_g8945 [Rhodofomes roseus]|uniref:Uncharacterized protein n=1 Tax=Rhodofomes roseus TaxID=34475 RepID=A0A4Y9XY37_9APHY|nr:hypothetical protein EVJ58_g8945 [Rhodofomes roseus]
MSSESYPLFTEYLLREARHLLWTSTRAESGKSAAKPPAPPSSGASSRSAHPAPAPLSHQRSADGSPSDDVNLTPKGLFTQTGTQQVGNAITDLVGAEAREVEVDLVLKKTPHLFPKDKRKIVLEWCDARLASEWKMSPRAVVTTANASWMPEFPVASPGQISTRTDGRWGPQEYSLWPQLYHPKVVHHACIPVKDATINTASYSFNVLYDPIPSHEWLEDASSGVPDLGFFASNYFITLKADVQVVLETFATAGGGEMEDQKQYGYHLCTVIIQALDRLNLLPTWRAHAIAIAAHVCRLTLEVLGLIILFDIVGPRARDPLYVAKTTLPLRGAFTTNPSTAQGLYRLGIPVWFIQTLTKHVRVLRVETPTPVSTMMSDELSQPRLYSGEGDLAGLVQHPGSWPYKMQQEAVKTLLDSILQPLLDDTREEITLSADAPPAKKARVDEDTDRVSAPAAATSSRKSRRPTHRSHRPPVASPQVSPHPSLRYKPLAGCAVPTMWADALSAVGTLPPPKVSSTYYWPPPFVFEGPGDKITRYFHNYVRIRPFLRQRLLDPTLRAGPLRVAEWRDALWGDYRVQVDEGTRSDINPRNKERRHVQQSIHRLFSGTGGYPSYHTNQTSRWGDTEVTVDAANDPKLRAQILWEVHEVNWRCELRELDTVMTGSRTWGTLQRWEREMAVARVWSVNGSGLRVIPQWDKGEGSGARWLSPPHREWAAARVAFRELLRLMARWPGLPEELKVVPVESVTLYNATDYIQLQLHTLRFYKSSHLDMAQGDPRVKAIVHNLLPSRTRLRNSLLPCAVLPEVRHVAIASLGATNPSSLGKVFGVCTLPQGHRCLNHLKPAQLQMSEVQLQYIRERVAHLDPPARLGGSVYVGADITATALAPTPTQGPGRPHLQTVAVDVHIYIKNGDVPILLPVLCIDRGDLLELTFRQTITCDVLGLKARDSYELFNHQLRGFVAYPRAHERRYFPRQDVLIYRAPGVTDCPGLDDLIWAGHAHDGGPGPAPLPSLLQHMHASLVATGNRSATPEDDAQAILQGTPGRVLRSGRVITPDASPSSSLPSSSARSTRSSQVSPAAGSVSAGVKRRRDDEVSTPSKRTSAKGKQRMEEDEDEDEDEDESQADEIWEVIDQDVEVLVV